MESVNLLGALLLGLMGAGHCLAMCGGIITSLSVSSTSMHSKNNWSYILFYQLGRISSYTLFGAFAGWLGLQFEHVSPLPILKTLSGVLLIAMALYISRVWLGLTYLERIGKLIWNLISPFTKHLMPVTNIKQAVLLGSIWGWLPCGLVYTSLGYALSLGDTLMSAAFMFTFGVGTLPATVFAGSASLSLKSFLNQKSVRNISALLFLIMGIYILFSIYAADSNLAHHHH